MSARSDPDPITTDVHWSTPGIESAQCRAPMPDDPETDPSYRHYCTLRAGHPVPIVLVNPDDSEDPITTDHASPARGAYWSGQAVSADGFLGGCAVHPDLLCGLHDSWCDEPKSLGPCNCGMPQREAEHARASSKAVLLPQDVVRFLRDQGGVADEMTLSDIDRQNEVYDLLAKYGYPMHARPEEIAQERYADDPREGDPTAPEREG